MKSTLLSILAFAFSFLGIIYGVGLFLLLVFSLTMAGDNSTVSPGTIVIHEPHSIILDIVVTVSPFVLAAVFVGLGFYCRWLSRKCVGK